MGILVSSTHPVPHSLCQAPFLLPRTMPDSLKPMDVVDMAASAGAIKAKLPPLHLLGHPRGEGWCKVDLLYFIDQSAHCIFISGDNAVNLFVRTEA